MVRELGKNDMPDTLTRRQAAVVAALAADGAPQFAPVQVQKLFFLIDENIAAILGGRLFAFQPYNYGPFDPDVYRELETLQGKGLVTITGTAGGPGQRRYSLTPAGYSAGKTALDALAPPGKDYIDAVSRWVRSMSFQALVGSIYRAYPRMRENSIFVS